jgi:hypothetical protein
MLREKRWMGRLLVAVSMGTVAVLAACGSSTGSGGGGPNGGGGGSGSLVCSGGSGPSICISKSTFAAGDSITVQFSGGPGKPKDWIAVYPSGSCAPSCPAGSTLWEYCGTNTQKAPASGVTSGTVTIDASANTQNWPLSGGDWDLLYLVDDGYSPIAKLTFHVDGADAGGGPSPSACDYAACSARSGGDFCSSDGICCGTTCGCTGSGSSSSCSCKYSCY